MPTIKRLLPVLLGLGLALHSCALRAQEAGWVSYRDAYRSMVLFAKYGKAKNFLQNHYQVTPRDAGATLDGLRLTLSGKTTQLSLPLDATGRTSFPLLKAAYDENAMLVLNRKISQFSFQPRLSIVPRLDGVYEAADLRTACDQALQYLRYTDAAYNAKRCVGVRFAFPKRSDANVRVRDPDRESGLAPNDGAAFDGENNKEFRVMVYRFADWPERVQVISQQAPVAIAPVIE
jgi:hypothetical protein